MRRCVARDSRGRALAVAVLVGVVVQHRPAGAQSCPVPDLSVNTCSQFRVRCGTRGTLSVVDEAWQKAMREGASADVIIDPGSDGRTRYEINLNRRIGYVGGRGGAAAGFPEARRIAIIVENLRNIVTAYPIR